MHQHGFLQSGTGVYTCQRNSNYIEKNIPSHYAVTETAKPSPMAMTRE